MCLHKHDFLGLKPEQIHLWLKSLSDCAVVSVLKHHITLSNCTQLSYRDGRVCVTQHSHVLTPAAHARRWGENPEDRACRLSFYWLLSLFVLCSRNETDELRALDCANPAKEPHWLQHCWDFSKVNPAENKHQRKGFAITYGSVFQPFLSHAEKIPGHTTNQKYSKMTLFSLILTM